MSDFITGRKHFVVFSSILRWILFLGSHDIGFLPPLKTSSFDYRYNVSYPIIEKHILFVRAIQSPACTKDRCFMSFSGAAPGIFPWWSITGNMWNIGATAPVTSADGTIN